MCKITTKQNAGIITEFLHLKCWTSLNYFGANQSSESSQYFFIHAPCVLTRLFLQREIICFSKLLFLSNIFHTELLIFFLFLRQNL